MNDGVADVLEEAVYWNDMNADETPEVVERPDAALWPTEAEAHVGLHSCREPVVGRESIVADTAPASMSCT